MKRLDAPKLCRTDPNQAEPLQRRRGLEGWVDSGGSPGEAEPGGGHSVGGRASVMPGLGEQGLVWVRLAGGAGADVGRTQSELRSS